MVNFLERVPSPVQAPHAARTSHPHLKKLYSGDGCRDQSLYFTNRILIRTASAVYLQYELFINFDEAGAGAAAGTPDSHLTTIILVVFTDLSVVRVTKYIPRAMAGTRTAPEDPVRGISHINFPLQEINDSRAFGPPP